MRIIIIGAALAGPTAAARAREINENAEIILLERNTRVSYAMAGLALHLSGEVAQLDDLNREREDFFRKVYNIDVRTQTEVTEIQPKRKYITIEVKGKREQLKYDTLIFAAGAASLHPVGAPENATNFRYFRTLDDLSAIKSSLAAGKKRFTILGGGSMGAEALDGLVRGGAEVTLIEKKSGFLPDYAHEISAIAALRVSEQAEIISPFRQLNFEMQGNEISAVIVDGKKIETDFVVSAIGVRPRTELLKKAGVKLLSDGSIRVDNRCQTNIKDIYACSICVSVPIGKDHVWIPQAAVSDKTAQVAGENAAGGKARLGRMTAAQLIRLPTVEIGSVGLKCDPKNRTASVLVHAHDFEPYMPGSSPMTLKLWYNTKTRQVTRLEAVGQNIKPRLDAFALALAGKLKLKDLSLLDLAYTPSSGTARDALNIAATVALQQSAGQTKLVSLAEFKAHRKKYLVLDVSSSATHAGFRDLHIPLEDLRQSLGKIRTKMKTSRPKQIATISETGRRGHLALRILQNAGFKVVNIAGGKKSASL